MPSAVLTAIGIHVARRYGLITAELEPIVGWFTTGAIAGITATLIAALLCLLIEDESRDPGSR
jgi:hypothetical protein